MHKQHGALMALMALGATAVLTACGGSDGPGVPVDTVPASATVSPEAFTRYAAALPADDGREPLDVQGLVPPTSETAEPLPLDR